MTEQRVRRTTKRPAWLNDGADVFDEMSGRCVTINSCPHIFDVAFECARSVSPAVRSHKLLHRGQCSAGREGRKSWQQQQQQQARLQVDGSSSDGFKQSRGAPVVGTVATSKLALPRRMCFNPACKNPFDSPQWRRGPLGPGTLCNACGTRYARVEARMRADKRGAPPRAVDVAEWRAFEAQLLQPLDPERAAVAAQLTAAEANAGPRSRRVARVRVAAGSMVNHPGGGLASESSPGAQSVAAAAAGRNHAHGLQQLQQRLLVLQQQEYDDECDEDDWGDEDPAADASSPCAGGSGSSQQPVGGVLPVQQLTAASTPGGGRQPSSTSLLWAALQGLPPHLRYDAMACSSSGPQTQSSPVRATAGTAPHLLLAACGGASPGSAPGAGSCGASPCKLDDGRGDGGGGAAATAGDSRAVRSPAPPNARVRPAHDDEASDSQEAAACCWREPGGTGGGSDQFLHLLAVGEAMIKTDGVALEDRQQAWSEVRAGCAHVWLWVWAMMHV
jgi:GATA zinc finger